MSVDGVIGVIGCGKVGFSHLAWLASRGWPVVGYDTNINVRREIRRTLKSGSVADTFEDLKHCTALHICVPTDCSYDGSADLNIFESVIDEIAVLLSQENSLKYVSQRSTCPPGTADRLAPLLNSISYGVNPSFLRKSSIATDTISPERIAYGGPQEFIDHMQRVHDGMSSPLFMAARSTVELLKYAENLIDYLLVSFWNELAAYAARSRITDEEFILLLDRMNDRNKFASVARVPGKAVGMWCLPKDIRAMVAEMNRIGTPSHTLRGAMETNNWIDSILAVGTQGSTALFDDSGGRISILDNGKEQIRRAWRSLCEDD